MSQNIQATIDPSQPTNHPLFHNSPDITGMTFERLTAVRFAGRNNRGLLIWECSCSCGGTTLAYSCGLRSGVKRSCGCLGRESTSKRSTTHGMSGTITLASWRSMRYRCSSPNSIGWARYGGRGITVCDRWQNSFAAFLEDMGKRPSKEYQIERIDNDGNYTPVNCRWATRKEQARNRKHNRMLTLNGETLCVAEWVERTGMKRNQIANRIHLGWDDERILTTPVRYKSPNAH